MAVNMIHLTSADEVYYINLEQVSFARFYEERTTAVVVPAAQLVIAGQLVTITGAPVAVIQKTWAEFVQSKT